MLALPWAYCSALTPDILRMPPTVAMQASRPGNSEGDRLAAPTGTITLMGGTLMGGGAAQALSLPGDATITGAGAISRSSIEIADAQPSPSVSLSPAATTITEGNGGDQLLTFTVTLSAPAASHVNVFYMTEQGSATAPSDFAGARGHLSFAVGEREKTFGIRILGDIVSEAEESFTVRLEGAIGAVLADTGTAATVTIQDNDRPPPFFTLLAASHSVLEGDVGDGTLSFTVQLSEPMPDAVFVSYATRPWSATSGSDYLAVSGTLRFAPGEVSRTFLVPIRGDRQDEADETFTVELSQQSGGALVPESGRHIVVTILDDDPTPATVLSLAATLGDRAEGSGAGVSVFTYVVTRSGDLSGTSEVGWSVTGRGLAAAKAADFLGGVLPAGTVSFAAGQAEQTIKVRVLRDALFEADESFQIDLAAPRGAGIGIGGGQAIGIIRNDDTPLASLAISGEVTDRAEGTGTGVSVFTYKVTRTGNLAEAVQAHWSVEGNGPAADAADFLGGVLPGGTISFAAGQAEQTIKVRALRDATHERDEYFLVWLTAPDGIEILNPRAGGIIRNDDPPPISFSLAAEMADRGEGSGTGVSVFSYVLTRSGDLAGSSHADWKVLGAFPAWVDAADFLGGVMPSGRVTFAPGEAQQTIKLRVLRDAEAEPDEHFYLLATPEGLTSRLTLSARGLIRDDDQPPATHLSLTGDLTERAEGTGGGVSVFSYAVTRSGDVSGASQVSWAVGGAGSSAADAADFLGGVLPGGTLRFAPDETFQTIKVRVQRDADHEADESFAVTLGNPSQDVAILGGTEFGTIGNDDPSPGGMAPSDHMLIG